MRRNSPAENAALQRVLRAAFDQAKREGMLGVFVQVVLPGEGGGVVTQAVACDEPLAFQRLMLDGLTCHIDFVERIGADQLKPLDPDTFGRKS